MIYAARTDQDQGVLIQSLGHDGMGLGQSLTCSHPTNQILLNSPLNLHLDNPVLIHFLATIKFVWDTIPSM